jgi:hypothetical protein
MYREQEDVAYFRTTHAGSLWLPFLLLHKTKY